MCGDIINNLYKILVYIYIFFLLHSTGYFRIPCITFAYDMFAEIG